MKGPRDGPAHTEYKYPLPVADALELLGPCGPRALVKHRHTLPDDWTVEEYAPPHAGLTVPEIEQHGDPTTPPPRPPRAGKDITSDRTYSNATPTTSPSP
ncbi:hypothetical protein RB625_34320 [Streptomyces californicus]|uniref:hypothetical protein n=1 Tax=Streptomyces californicus TaxID=67351 RepID=UPI00296EA402|nr:hypothetical protein [Streptomyces californicus]MDW4903483.1 hypothetical protein [Streptomyces californicus]